MLGSKCGCVSSSSSSMAPSGRRASGVRQLSGTFSDYPAIATVFFVIPGVSMGYGLVGTASSSSAV